MKNFYSIKKIGLQLFSFVLLISVSSCENLFEYSPYQVLDDGLETKRNETAMKEIASLSQSQFKPFKVALIGDTHTFYDDFGDQIEAINKNDSIDFVVHMGDITVSGIYREFVWFGDIIDKLNKPVVTLIGNHDCLSNGEMMYKEVLGETNFSFEYNNCRLVFFDDNIWERSGKDPNFQWLSDSLKGGEGFTHQFVFAHIFPWDGQFSIGNSYLYNYIMENSRVTASIHGHGHSFSYDKHYGKIPYLLTGDAPDREIVILEVKQDTILVNKIKI